MCLGPGGIHYSKSSMCSNTLDPKINVTVTWIECPAGFMLKRNVSLNEGSRSCLHTLVFFLITLFCVATLMTYSFTYKSATTVEKKMKVCG